MDKIKKTLKAIFYCFTGFNADNWIYKTVALIGLLLRVWLFPILIPDIFEVIATFFISSLNFPPLLYEILIRIILFVVDGLSLSHAFYWISYVSVGNLYEKGSTPAWGSVCYTIYYCGYSAMPVIIFQHFNWLWIVSTFCLYALITCILYIVSAKMYALPDSWIFRLTLQIIIFVIVIVVVCLLKCLVFK